MGILRFLLALSVVFAHSGEFILTSNHFVGGLVAVEAFFILSGFYMALVLDKKYSQDRHSFYKNRLLRIFPTYWAVLFLAVFSGFLLGEDKISQMLDANLSWGTLALMWSANSLIFGSDVMMFFSSGMDGLYFTGDFNQEALKLHTFHYIPQAWSLPLELMFYAIVPFYVQRKRLIVAVIIGSLLIKLGTFAYFGAIDPWIYRFFPSELMMFCLGMLSYRLYVFLKEKNNLQPQRGFLALIMVVSCTLWFENIAASMYIKMWVYFIMLVCLIPYIFDYCKKNRVDRFIGELSYPIYLCHLIVIATINFFDLSLWGDQSMLYVLGTIGLAIVLHLVVSAPIEKRFRAG